MQVKILQNIIYKGEVYTAGKEAEIDDVSARVLENRGAVKILGGTIDTDFTPAESLPDLVSQNAGKKKK